MKNENRKTPQNGKNSNNAPKIRKKVKTQTESAETETNRVGTVETEKASSIKHAAALMGVPAEVLKQARNMGCPGFDDHHRVDCGQVGKWLAQHHELLTLPNSEIRTKQDAEIKFILLRCDRTEFDNEVKRGKYIEKSTIAAKLLKLATGQVTILRQKLENEFPALLAGKSIDEMREEGRKLVDQLHGQMRELAAEWGEV